jgi:ketosteroid isomerase-like protein
MIPAIDHGESARAQANWSAPQDEEAAIRERIDSLIAAIREKNLDQVLRHYLPDVVVYDLTAPLDVRGIGAYRRKFERWFGAMAGRIHYEIQDLHVSAGPTGAVSHCLSHITGARTGGGRVDYCVRVTSSWRREGGSWLVAHEHISMPTLL